MDVNQMPAVFTKLEHDTPQWQKNSPLLVVPSWAASLAIHSLILLILISSLNRCDSGQTGGEDGELRSVGIYLKQSPDAEQTDEPDQELQEPTQNQQALQSQEQLKEVMDQPPVTPLLPELNSKLLGAGPLQTPNIPSAPTTDLTTDTLMSPQTALAPPVMGTGEVNFFDAVDSGKRFVFVLDSSGSMAAPQGAPIRKARKELIASLEGLTHHQQFQIIFYNTETRAMKYRGKPTEMLYATDINRTLARQFIQSIDPDGGTAHTPALKRALSFRPDVIFFLTDAKHPQLSSADLNEIRVLNNGKAKIHCIEFGEGFPVKEGNSLDKLARQNRGSYRYFNVRKFIINR
ncbi:MAG: VWA domain-containing protein [Planctomycetes bacterium]|nr:VWA domain-containing protein [Planctomycetota bacterium]MCH9779273.1 VWA domain-containing protein [Planctomycetota bacterium]MCH9792338.1 VWA domain-containing protein [Planctomycetota bacterium]